MVSSPEYSYLFSQCQPDFTCPRTSGGRTRRWSPSGCATSPFVETKGYGLLHWLGNYQFEESLIRLLGKCTAKFIRLILVTTVVLVIRRINIIHYHQWGLKAITLMPTTCQISNNALQGAAPAMKTFQKKLRRHLVTRPTDRNLQD
jgi:hypothetical protein